MPKTLSWSNQAESASPDYPRLVQFLVSPFLESPESLSVDCEQFNQKQRVWIRLAFEMTDKVRVYGRSGRNLQAIRTVLETAAASAGQTICLEVYESKESRPRRHEGERGERNYDFDSKPHPRRKHRSGDSTSPRFSLKTRP